MTQQSRKLLVVEIRIADETDFDSSQVVPLTVYQDACSYYHSHNQMVEIKRAMGDAVAYFGNNFRHPLLYDVRVVPGDEMDAIIASSNNSRTRSVERRIRRTENN